MQLSIGTVNTLNSNSSNSSRCSCINSRIHSSLGEHGRRYNANKIGGFIHSMWMFEHNKHKYRNGIALRRHLRLKTPMGTATAAWAANPTQTRSAKLNNDGYLISHFVDIPLINGVSLSLSDWKFMFLLLVRVLVCVLCFTRPADVRWYCPPFE